MTDNDALGLPVLSRSAFVLDQRVVGQHGDEVTFWCMSDGGVFDVRALTLPVEVWTDFGRPNAVTVTVEPGDTLNG